MYAEDEGGPGDIEIWTQSQNYPYPTQTTITFEIEPVEGNHTWCYSTSTSTWNIVTNASSSSEVLTGTV